MLNVLLTPELIIMQQLSAPRTNTVFRYLLPLMMLVAVAVLTLSPKEANAQSGKRICVGQNGAYAIKITKNTWLNSSREKCTDLDMDETDLSQSINFGKGTYMTCETFASNYLKWEEWDPCYEMNKSNIRQSNGANRWGPTDSQIYTIAMIDKDESILSTGSPCGASGGCSLTFNFGQSRSFNYTSGININLPIGPAISFSYGSGQSASQLFGFSWLKGEESGMNLNFVSNFPKWSFRTINLLQSRLRAHTRQIAEVEEQKEITDWTRFCSQGQTVQARDYYNPGSVSTYSVGGLYWFFAPNSATTYAGALQHYNDDNSDYGNGTTATLGSTAIICGQALQITTSPTAWRDGHNSSNLQWKNYLTYNLIN
jgi:hypothetical protein